MTVAGWIEIALFVALLTALTPLLGGYMARVFRGEPVCLDRVVGPLERGTYRAAAASTRERGQDWKAYARSVLVFSAAFGVAALPDPAHAGHAPVQPAGPRRRHRGTSRSTRPSSFVTNTNWQYYARRDDAVVLLADGRPGRAELRLGRRRHRRR